MNSEMESLYRETYARAYRMRHPRSNRVRIMSAIVSVVMVLAIAFVGVPRAISFAFSPQEGNSEETVVLSEVTPEEVATAPTTSPTNTYMLAPLASADTHLTDYLPEDIQVLSYTEESINTVDTDLTYDSTAPPQEIEPAMEIVEEQEGIPEEPVPESLIPVTAEGSRAVLTEEELAFVERVVEAEVTGTSYRWNGEDVSEEEMLLAKIRVCQVFLNRAENTERFSHITTLYEAVTEPGASSTVLSGRCWRVEVTDLTKEAVQIALDPNTEDYTDGALFFLADGETKCKYGEYLFTDDVGHSFFK